MLKCECGNDKEFIKETTVSKLVDSKGKLYRKIHESNPRYFCPACRQEVWK